MTSLMHFEDKVHRKGPGSSRESSTADAKTIMPGPRALGFSGGAPDRDEVRCPQVLSMERAMVMPISFILQQQDQEEVPVPEAEHSHRGGSHASEPEMERSQVPDRFPPSPTLPTSVATPADTPGPSFTSQHSPEYVHASSREITGVMDAICSLAATQAAQDQRLDRAEATLEDCRSMLQQIMTHLGLPRAPVQRDEPTAGAAASLDVLATAAAATDPTTNHSSEVVRFLLCFCIVTSFINCLLILIRIHVLAIVGSETFVCLALYSCTSHFGYIKSYSIYIYRLLHIIFCASTLFNCFCLQLNN